MNSCPLMPKPNEGKLDRVVRMIVGIVLLGFAFFSLTGLMQTIAGVMGAVALITGAVGFCGLYKIFGISTIEKK